MYITNLQQCYDGQIQNKQIKDLDRKDNNLILDCNHFIINLKREKITNEFLLDAQRIYDLHIKDKVKEIFNGTKVNQSENLEALYFISWVDQKLIQQYSPRAQEIYSEYQQGLQNLKYLDQKIAQDQLLNLNGDKFSNIIYIGIGGSYLGTKSLIDFAKRVNPQNKSRFKVKYLTTFDISEIEYQIRGIDLLKSIIIVASKSFTTQETLLNANYLKNKLIKEYEKQNNKIVFSQKQIIQNHFFAVSANKLKVFEFGVNSQQYYPLWSEVGGRYSVSTFIGGLLLSMMFGYEYYEQFVKGSAFMDNLFVNEQITLNIPCLMAILDVYNSKILKMNTKVICPYTAALKSLIKHVQQIEMESLGKNFNVKDNRTLQTNELVGQFIMGDIGTDCQHSFMQSLHQGLQAHVEFVYFKENQSQILNNNLQAQSEALSIGDQSYINTNKYCQGNCPNFIIEFKSEINMFDYGVLNAFYEHWCVARGLLEDINPFDQPGVDLGKRLALEKEGGKEQSIFQQFKSWIN